MQDELRKVMHLVNKYFMVPAYQLGLGGLVSSPFSGYIMVIQSTGRKTGKRRFSPVNYAIRDGCAYCMAGFGSISDWYRNVKANPNVEVLLPGGAFAGVVEEVSDEAERLAAVRATLINAGFAGYFMGFNPRTASDELILEKLQGCPLMRIRPRGIASGPADPGGWLWMLVYGGFLLWLAAKLMKCRCRKK
ncbi:MAG: nitroreductase family deazaflavin-dependent oxidoreductase [Chloroflexi bacterium]|nr:nitroreductase family deazaflavin-dependent oxidoreductase [Chloroflexota bacterium]